MEMQSDHTLGDWKQIYEVLPIVFLGLFVIWSTSLGVWMLNTWCKRRWQTSNLQWTLTAVPLLKSVVLALSFTFWFTCLNLNMCSFWVAFGVFVTRIFYETVCFISFLMIANGYCIIHEQLSIEQRRTIAGLGSIFYISLTGYKAALPQFAIVMVVIYLAMFGMILLHVSRSLKVLQDQLRQIQAEGIHLMHNAVYAKYTMLKKFQGTMVITGVAKILMHARADDVPSDYWLCLLLRELTEIGIFFHIGWTFRSRHVTRFFTVIPALHAPGQRSLPPIYSIEMNEKEFDSLNLKDWHIGVPTSGGGGGKAMLVVVQNPGGISHRRASEEMENGKENTSNTSVEEIIIVDVLTTKDQRSQM